MFVAHVHKLVEEANVCPLAIMESMHTVNKYSEVGRGNLVKEVNLHPVVVIEVMQEIRELLKVR